MILAYGHKGRKKRVKVAKPGRFAKKQVVNQFKAKIKKIRRMLSR